MRAIAVLLVAAACRSAPPAAPVIGERGGATADACAGQVGLVARARGPIAARWNHHVSTGGEGTLDVRWCGDGAVHVQEVAAGGELRWTRTYDPDRHVLTRGAAVALTITGRGTEGTQPLTVTVVDEAGRVHRASTTVESVDDPARAAERAACRTCGGRWGAVGMSGYETCDCPTHDAGKRCTSDDDCESVCIATGFEAVPASAAPGLTCAPGERLEELVGRCHDRQHAFGCRSRIGDATGPRCSSPHFARRLPTTCTD